MRTEETVELRWILRVIGRWAWLIVICSLLALIVASLVTSRTAPVYEATTTLLIAPAEQTITSEFNSLMAGEKLALTYVQLLKGPAILQTAIDRLGLAMTPEALAKKIEIEPVADTQLVRVTAKDGSPAGAALLANTIADVSVEFARTLEVRRYRDYLASKEAKIAAQLGEVDATKVQVDALTAKKIADAVKLARLQGLLAEQQAALQQQRVDLQALELLVARVKDNVKIAEAAAAPAAGASSPYTATLMLLVDQGAASVGTGYSVVLSSDQLALTYSQILARRSVLDAAIAKLGANDSPDPEKVTVKAEPVPGTQLVRLQVGSADPVQTANLANALADVFVAQIQELLSEPYVDRLAGMEAEVSSLEGLVGATQQAIEKQTATGLQTEIELGRTEALLAEYRGNYRILEQEYDQARLLSSQASGTMVITEHARDPRLPTGNKTLYVLLAVAVSGLVAFGAALLIEYLDESIKTAEDVNRALGLNSLGIIAQSGRDPGKPAVTSKTHSRTAEAFSMLATNVRLASLEGNQKVLLVTSAAPGDGKTTVACNLAVAAANAGLRVVLVDADLRQPRAHEFFNLSKLNGLTEALLPGDPKGFLKPSGVDRLYILTSGQPPQDPVNVVNSPRLKKLLDELIQDADLVIIDSPPVLAVADATLLATISDGVLLVVRSGRTATQAARRATAALRQTKAHILGAVLNAAPGHTDGYYGHYYKQAEKPRRRSPARKLAGLFATGGSAPRGAQPAADTEPASEPRS